MNSPTKLLDMKNFILCIFFCSLAFSCKKSNVDDFPNIVGNWQSAPSSTNYKIDVKDNGKTVYEKTTDNSTLTVKGKVRISGTEMKIGLKKFNISVLPNLPANGGKYTMTVDEIIYFRD